MSLQFLESLDSVRGAGNRTTPDAGLSEAQAMLETVMALALGRDVVVPQSYAIDSATFLAVAERVLTARQRAGTGATDHPFRPHLFGQGVNTFDTAIKAMLARVHDDDRPFVSSLRPDLSGLDAGEIRAFVEDLDEFQQWAGGVLTGRLQLVRDEFRRTARVVPQQRPDGVRLDRALTGLVDPASDLHAAAGRFDEDARTTFERLVSAVRRLDPASPAAFGQRSRLRQDAPWPNDPRGRTAREILGEGDLSLVTEFVDTLYNRAVFDSIGVASGSFSTSLHLGPDLDRARVVAQRLALGRRPTSASAVPGTGELPLFDVHIDAGAAQDRKALTSEVGVLLDRGGNALVELFRVREGGRESAPDNEFWRSVRALEEAAVGSDEKAYRKALDAHLGLVASVLNGRAEITSLKETGTAVLAGAGLGGLPEIVLAGSLLEIAVTAAAGAVSGALVPLGRRGGHRRRTRRLASALGDFVGVAPVAGAAA